MTDVNRPIPNANRCGMVPAPERLGLIFTYGLGRQRCIPRDNNVTATRVLP